MFGRGSILQARELRGRTVSSYTIQYECDSGNGYDGDLGVRISSIFVIALGSFLGALLPIAAARTKRMHVPPLAFFITKYFGSGVIIATAFIHLLAPATEALNSPCLTGAITTYSWAEGICLMTVFSMFLIELLAARFEVFGDDALDLEHTDPSHELMRQSEKSETQSTLQQPFQDTAPPSHQHGQTQNQNGNNLVAEQPESSSNSVKNGARTRVDVDLEAGESASNASRIPGRQDDFTYPPGGEDHLGHQRDHTDDDDNFAAQMTAIFILEFGVIFHSIFIGLTLAVAGDNFIILYIVLVFHQTFEGLGLGSRLATTHWPRKKRWLPWVLGSAYGFTTPLAIAIGLGVRTTFTPGSSTTMIVNGVFDSISAGILIYTGLVELMAHEFMFNPEMRKSSINMMLFAFGCMCFGAGLMALLGKWA